MYIYIRKDVCNIMVQPDVAREREREYFLNLASPTTIEYTLSAPYRSAGGTWRMSCGIFLTCVKPLRLEVIYSKIMTGLEIGSYRKYNEMSILVSPPPPLSPPPLFPQD